MRKKDIIDLLLNMSDEIEEFEYMEQLTYVFILLFLKINMDTNEYNKQMYEKKYSKDIVEQLMKKQQIIIKITWKELYKNVDNKQFGMLLDKYLEDIEQMNPCLTGVFKEIYFSKIPYKKLIKMMNLLNNETLIIDEENREDFNNAIDEFRFNAKFENKILKTSPGMGFTPLAVADIISKIINVKENEEVGDLVCGSGGLLLKTIQYVTNDKVQIYAQDKEPSMVNLCKLNMLLHDIYDSKVKNEDAITQISEEKFDVVIGNPPFSMQNEIKKTAEESEILYYNEQFPYGIPPASKSDYAFIQRMLQSLKVNGRMATFISLGALFRSGAEKEIRKNLLNDNVIETIILLPQNIFKNTSIKTCIMICRKNKIQRDVLFIDASELFEKGKYKNEITEEMENEIVKIVKERKTIKGISYLATIKEILENDGNLSVTKYVEKEKTGDIDITRLRKQISEKEKELIEIRNRKILYEKKLEEV